VLLDIGGLGLKELGLVIVLNKGMPLHQAEELQYLLCGRPAVVPLLLCQQRINLSHYQRTKMSPFQRQHYSGLGLEPVN